MNLVRSTTSPLKSLTVTWRRARARDLLRAISETKAGIWPARWAPCMNWPGSMPYCCAVWKRKSKTSSRPTLTSRASARVSRMIWSRTPLVMSSRISSAWAASSALPSASRCCLISLSTTSAGTSKEISARRCSSRASRAATAWSSVLRSTTCWRRSSSISSTVSNSEAIEAKSSSTSGSSRCLTASTSTVTAASSPSCSPPARVVVKTADSPALSPSRAASSPWSILPLPIS